jgi:hypothetical protein
MAEARIWNSSTNHTLEWWGTRPKSAAWNEKSTRDKLLTAAAKTETRIIKNPKWRRKILRKFGARFAHLVRKENREKQICGCPPLTDQTLSSTTSRPRKPTMEHPNADEWTGLRLAPTKIETRSWCANGKATRVRNLARENSELGLKHWRLKPFKQQKTKPNISAAKTNYRKEPAPRSSTMESKRLNITRQDAE